MNSGKIRRKFDLGEQNRYSVLNFVLRDTISVEMVLEDNYCITIQWSEQGRGGNGMSQVNAE